MRSDRVKDEIKGDERVRVHLAVNQPEILVFNISRNFGSFSE